jgi:hypothetical protein
MATKGNAFSRSVLDRHIESTVQGLISEIDERVALFLSIEKPNLPITKILQTPLAVHTTDNDVQGIQMQRRIVPP